MDMGHNFSGECGRRAACALLALSLHFPAIVALGTSGSAPRQSLESQQMQIHERPLIVTALLFARGNGAADETFAASMHQQSLQSIHAPIPRVELEAVAADSFELPEPISDNVELQEARRLQGVYVGQIMSRLKRMLEESRAFPLPSSTQCVIHVLQDERGRVLEVQDDECSAQATLREQIARAVRIASPLPTPPQGLAMGSYITLDLAMLQQRDMVGPLLPAEEFEATKR